MDQTTKKIVKNRLSTALVFAIPGAVSLIICLLTPGVGRFIPGVGFGFLLSAIILIIDAYRRIK